MAGGLAGLRRDRAAAAAPARLDPRHARWHRPRGRRRAHAHRRVRRRALGVLGRPRDAGRRRCRPASTRDSLPQQVHGLRFSEQRLRQIGATVLVDDLALAATPAPGQAAVPLRDRDGKVVQYVVWDAAAPRRQHPAAGGGAARRRAPDHRPDQRDQLGLRGALGAAARAGAPCARAADRSKTEFLSNVSHELRTPMNGILGVAQLLQTTELDAEQRELVEVLFSSANAQMALISDLLDFSRLESGNRQPGGGAVRAGGGPEGRRRDDARRRRPQGDRARDRLGGSRRAESLRGDARAFRQIVTNLVGNAVKFTDRGRVGLQARGRRATPTGCG